VRTCIGAGSQFRDAIMLRIRQIGVEIERLEQNHKHLSASLREANCAHARHRDSIAHFQAKQAQLAETMKSFEQQRSSSHSALAGHSARLASEAAAVASRASLGERRLNALRKQVEGIERHMRLVVIEAETNRKKNEAATQNNRQAKAALREVSLSLLKDRKRILGEIKAESLRVAGERKEENELNTVKETVESILKKQQQQQEPGVDGISRNSPEFCDFVGQEEIGECVSALVSTDTKIYNSQQLMAKLELSRTTAERRAASSENQIKSLEKALDVLMKHKHRLQLRVKLMLTKQLPLVAKRLQSLQNILSTMPQEITETQPRSTPPPPKLEITPPPARKQRAGRKRGASCPDLTLSLEESSSAVSVASTPEPRSPLESASASDDDAWGDELSVHSTITTRAAAASDRDEEPDPEAESEAQEHVNIQVMRVDGAQGRRRLLMVPGSLYVGSQVIVFESKAAPQDNFCVDIEDVALCSHVPLCCSDKTQHAQATDADSHASTNMTMTTSSSSLLSVSSSSTSTSTSPSHSLVISEESSVSTDEDTQTQLTLSRKSSFFAGKFFLEKNSQTGSHQSTSSQHEAASDQPRSNSSSKVDLLDEELMGLSLVLREGCQNRFHFKTEDSSDVSGAGMSTEVKFMVGLEPCRAVERMISKGLGMRKKIQEDKKRNRRELQERKTKAALDEAPESGSVATSESSSSSPRSGKISGVLNIDIMGRSHILSEPELTSIIERMKILYQVYTWRRIFSMDRDGTSLNHLLDCIRTHSTSLLVIQDQKGKAFGGVLSHSGQTFGRRRQYFGNGESFMFERRGDKKQNQNQSDACDIDGNNNSDVVKIYKWTGTDQNDPILARDDECFAIGGKTFALFLDHKLKEGGSEPSEMFGSPCLASGRDFRCYGLELWAPFSE